MADQIPKIKSERQVLQLKLPHLCFQALMLGLCILTANIFSVYAATCPPSVPSCEATTTEQYNFPAYTTAYTDKVVAGPMSNSLYYLYWVFEPQGVIVRKVNASGSQTWKVLFAFNPIIKSLSVDAAEQSVYFSSFSNPLVVLKLSSSAGSIVSQHQYNGINGQNDDIKTWPLTDLSGYFVIGIDSSNVAKICKYTFSLSSAQCQTITNIKFGFGHLMISNSQFFVLGVSTTSPYNLQMFKITFSLTSVNWANQIACSAGTCTAYDSESVLSSDGSTIYSFSTFGVTTYLYFLGLSVSDGSVTTTRFRSSASVLYILGSALNGDYVVATTYPSTSASIVIYRISSSTFTIKSFSGSLHGCCVEPSSGRFVVNGIKNSYGYTTKFVVQSIILNSDFSTDILLMAALPAGTDDVVTQSGVSIAAPDALFTPIAGPYGNQIVAYNLISSITSDAYLQTDAQAFLVSESTTSTQVPNLSCSFSGSTPIVFSLSSYNGVIVPNFVSINSTTGVLTIAAPSVSSSKTYSFYITSMISGVSTPVQKIINLTVKKCTVGNCQICTITDSSVCATCNPGYSLSLGSCDLPKTQTAQQETSKSETAQLLSTTNQVVIGAVIVISVGSSLTNLSSMASLWSIINQMQILFFLFLTGAFIPKDIEDIITGLSICLNPFSYLQLKFIGNYDFVSNYFDFGLENNNLERFGIKSDSTIVNMTSFLLSIIIICILHFCIFLTQKLLAKESKSNCCSYILSCIHKILQKLMVLFTFTLYIRIILQTNQYILISCVSEINQFNFYGIKRKISTIIAFLVLIACISTIVITILLTLSKDAYKTSEFSDRKSKFSHLFNGVSINKKSRMFVCLLQIRRVIFVILLITVGPKSSIIVISLLVGLQLIYLVILVTIRPYCEISCNMIEIINELYFLIILASLLKYNTVASWEGTPTIAYTWLISFNSLVGILVIFDVKPVVASRIDNSVNDAAYSNGQMNNENPAINIQFGPRTTRFRVGNRVYVKR